MALGVALAEPQLEEGAGAAEASEVVALEVVPELSAIASAAFAVASDARLLSLQGSFYDHDLLRRAVRGAQVVYAYASKFDSADGQHAERLSAALAAALRACPDGGRGCVVGIVNRRLCEADGWRVAAPPLQGPTPEESARVGVARFYRLVAPPGTGVS
mmetsp:Transcript_11167/g.35743  ORF Transcript_11167/g.35743 Transcript_11167/m.35743 type:complete len:159 (+) Transcript_11167:2-478(+)